MVFGSTFKCLPLQVSRNTFDVYHLRIQEAERKWIAIIEARMNKSYGVSPDSKFHSNPSYWCHFGHRDQRLELSLNTTDANSQIKHHHYSVLATDFGRL